MKESEDEAEGEMGGREGEKFRTSWVGVGGESFVHPRHSRAWVHTKGVPLGTKRISFAGGVYERKGGIGFECLCGLTHKK